MVFNILRQFNWLDILILFLIFRVLYISIKGGFVVEIFKLTGLLSAIYLSMHYYLKIADFVRNALPLKEKMPLEFLDFLVFLILAGIGYLFFLLLRSAFNNLIKIEAVSTLNKWGGLALGSFRSLILSSLLIFLLAISSVPYLKNSTKASYFGRRLVSISINIYTWGWSNIFSKFASSEKLNRYVVEVRDWMVSR
ncbi:MAG: CvpA family protein [Candidatus Omnitrophota bacterium]